MYYFDYNAILNGVAEYGEGYYTTEDCNEITNALRAWAQDNNTRCCFINDIPSDVFQDIVENY